MPEGPSISLDDFARVTARLQAGMPRERALDGTGIDEPAWLVAQQAWLERIAKRMASGERALHRRFLDKLSEFAEEEAAKKKQSQLDGDAPRPLAERMAPQPSKRRPRPAKRVEQRVAPIMPRAPRVEVAVQPPKEDRTMAFAIPPTASPLPFVKGQANAAMKANDEPEHDEAGETLDPATPNRSALPFKVEEDLPTTTVETLDVATSTLEPPTSTLDPEPTPAPVLPFKGGAPNKERKRVLGPDGALPFRPPSEPPARSFEEEDPLARTSTGDGIKIRQPALPFAEVKAERRAGEARPRVESGLPFKPKQKPKDVLAGTTELTPDELAKAARGLVRAAARRTPIDPLAHTMAVSPEQMNMQPRLTLDQFASLTAELAVAPREAMALEKRYGLAAGGHDREKRAWAVRFLDDPKLSDVYATKVRQYRAWLQRQR